MEVNRIFWIPFCVTCSIYKILPDILQVNSLCSCSGYKYNLKAFYCPYAIYSQSISQFSRSVMSNSLLPIVLQHTRLPCPSPTPGAYSNLCPLNQWCHPTISSSIVPITSRLQSFPGSRSFQMSQLFTSGGQSIGVSASVLPMNIHVWFLLGLTGWISLQSKGLSTVFSNTTVQKHQFLGGSAFFIVQLSHPTIALTRQIIFCKVMSLLFNMLSTSVIAFLLMSKRLLISWVQSPYAMILEPPKIKAVSVSIVSPSIWHEEMGLDAMILVFSMLSFKPTFLLSSFTFIKKLFSSLLSAIRMVSSAYLKLLIFLPAILIPACASSSLAFHMMYSAYKLNKQGDNIQPWHTPFLIWNQSVVPCPI